MAKDETGQPTGLLGPGEDKADAPPKKVTAIQELTEIVGDLVSQVEMPNGSRIMLQNRIADLIERL